jgi:hypothetical protein
MVSVCEAFVYYTGGDGNLAVKYGSMVRIYCLSSYKKYSKNTEFHRRFIESSPHNAVSRCAFIALFAGQQRPHLLIPPRMRQHPRPADQGRVVPHMLVVPTSQLSHPMVFLVLEVAGYGLLHGV